MLSSHNTISKKITNVFFGYYSGEEIRNMSVKEISNPKAFDQMNHPIGGKSSPILINKGGLYDPLLGVQPHERGSRCPSCGQESYECPGHIGHIELLLPVYNPFLVTRILQLLKAKCFFCHKLRMPKERKKHYQIKFKLLKLGHILLMKQYEELYLKKLRLNRNIKRSKDPRKQSDHTQTRKSSDSTTRPQSEGDQNHKITAAKREKEIQSLQNDELEIIKSEIRAIIDMTKVKKHQEKYEQGVVLTSHILCEIKMLTKQFFKDISKKCPYCNKQSLIVRKEGMSKFFLIERNKGSTKSDVIMSKKVQGEGESEGENNLQEEESDLQNEKKKSKHKYLNPLEISEHIRLLWEYDARLLKVIFGSYYIDENTIKFSKKGSQENFQISIGYELKTINPSNFFIDVLNVMANRFRPENKVNDQTFLHGHTVAYTRILEINHELRTMITKLNQEPQTKQMATNDSVGNKEIKQSEQAQKVLKGIFKLETVFQKWLELQDCIVGLFNSEKAQAKSNRDNAGVKQLLERKQGLFRMKIMGKRVNYACRSVISPDPLLNTNQVGVPLVLARKLIIPEPVNQNNYSELSQLILNGPQTYPGALYFQDGVQKLSLEYLTQAQRLAIVKELQNGEEKVVWRQLKTGDVMLFNRQPTLHKPSIMGHIARVLPNEQTIRFHYANCKSYNADFDGDEMNLHFLQSYIAKSEALNICLNDYQYISPTNGKPIRELIQDMIVSAVFLTMRDTFLTKSVYQQLLYLAVWNLYSEEDPQMLFFMQPAIIKPKELWTGKQLISSIMRIIVQRAGQNPDIGLNMEGKAKISMKSDDQQILVKDNELLLGVLDKNQLGSGADYGMVHAFYEMYGPTLTGQLLTALARVFTAFLQIHGFTCGMDDLTVDKDADLIRVQMCKQNLFNGFKQGVAFCGLQNVKLPADLDLLNRPTLQVNDKGRYQMPPREQNKHYLPSTHKSLMAVQRKILSDNRAEESLDGEYKRAMMKTTSEIVQMTLDSLTKKFPRNLFSCMTLSGAKGSNVNHSQISVLLGQQELEGRRVPIMPTGRTLPSFQPYDPNPRAGGYIADRFLSGLRPQEFFFHCMAGREGLVDTAVKTSRSGYLQRCLIKHLEGLIVQYDLTVRDNDGSLIQFYYGEDGVDTTKTKYLEKWQFLKDNMLLYKEKFKPGEMKKKLDTKAAGKFEYGDDETLLNNLNPFRYLGSVSESLKKSMNNFLEKEQVEKPRIFKTLSQIRYIKSLIQPGEPVGCVAGQSVGEPSTQMTLNTFHLAGHGEKNVTLGIPRLREILMTATKKQKTPNMSLQFWNKKTTKLQAERYAKRMSRLVMLELVKQIKVEEYKRLTDKGQVLEPIQRGVFYEISIQFEDYNAIQYTFGLSIKMLKEKVAKDLLPLLSRLIFSELNKNSKRSMEKSNLLLKKPQSEFQKKKKKRDDELDDDEDEEEELEQDEMEEFEISSLEKKSQFEQEILEEKEKQVEDKHNVHSLKYVENLQFNGDTANVVIKLPLNSKKILMTNIMKKSLSNTVIQEIRGIQKAKILKNDKGECQFYLYTEGVNLRAMKNLDFINPYTIESNDIGAILSNFGIEAARKSIIKEILAVFGHYGVSVDYRHLYLIADYMTFGGIIRAMNRIWMDFNTSPFLKMSFETSTQFLTTATINRQNDNLSNVSAQLTVGRVPRLGTNLCDILYQIKDEDENEEQ